MQQPWNQITVHNPSSAGGDLLRIFKRTGNCIALHFLRWMKEGKALKIKKKEEEEREKEMLRNCKNVEFGFHFPCFFWRTFWHLFYVLTLMCEAVEAFSKASSICEVC